MFFFLLLLFYSCLCFFFLKLIAQFIISKNIKTIFKKNWNKRTLFDMVRSKLNRRFWLTVKYMSILFFLIATFNQQNISFWCTLIFFSFLYAFSKMHMISMLLCFNLTKPSTTLSTNARFLVLFEKNK